MTFDETRIRNFREKLGPKIKNYAQDNPSSIMAIPTAGKLFAVDLYRFLLAEGIPITYFETEKDRVVDTLRKSRDLVYGRTLIPVDDDIYTQETYRKVQAQIDEVKGELKLKDILWVVEYDGPGVAHWSCNRNNVKFPEELIPYEEIELEEKTIKPKEIIK